MAYDETELASELYIITLSQSVLGSKQDWVSRAEKYARQRGHIRQILAASTRGLDLGEIAFCFKNRFGYIPSDLCRRLREVVAENNGVVKVDGLIATWMFLKE